MFSSSLGLSVPAIVALDCFWSDGGLNCTPYAGYTIETSEISSTLILGMAKSSEGQEGRYRCKVSSSLPGKETPCDFRLKGTMSRVVSVCNVYQL